MYKAYLTETELSDRPLRTIVTGNFPTFSGTVGLFMLDVKFVTVWM